MPAAAVIPAPVAYIKVVAVKKLVVETLGIGPNQNNDLVQAPYSQTCFHSLTCVEAELRRLL